MFGLFWGWGLCVSSEFDQRDEFSVSIEEVNIDTPLSE